ncbi:hypothetical protein KR084_012501 [Drosophila pseudotakahashii]|nr:hypothetical protein KR084_012501 [Drosophila pseudotakahashii]
MADKAAAEKPAGRPMRYPYTFSAKIAQFPIKHYIKNQWIWRYYFIAAVACVPVFYKISKLGSFNIGFHLTSSLMSCFPPILANSPENKKAWAESQAKEHAEHH